MKTILLLFLLSVNSYSQEYVTPGELEEGWGFGYTHPIWSFYSYPINVISKFNISGDEKLLYIEYNNYKNSDGREIYKVFFDIEKNQIVNPNNLFKAISSNDSKFKVYFNEIDNTLFIQKNEDLKILDCEALYSNCNLEKKFNCYDFQNIVKDENNNYYCLFFDFITENNIDIYKVNLDSLFEKECLVYDFLYNYKRESKNNTILFSQNSLNFFIETNSPNHLINGFKLIQNFNEPKFINIPKKNDWYVTLRYEPLIENLYFYSYKSAKLGLNGDVYYYTSFRSESEPNSSDNYKPENHPEAKEARDASGIYRIDTNGHNPVQLVRSWTNHPGGLQISGDGETIYYAYILPDSTSAIMKMDRYGKNKEIVFKLDPKALSVEKQILTPKIFPNPASEYVTISGIGNGKAIIYNSIGQKLMEQDITSASEINISNLQSGIYIIKLENAGNITFEKFMVGR